jgi:hypothetical protein
MIENVPYPVDPKKEAERLRKQKEYEDKLRREAQERIQRLERERKIEEAKARANKRQADKEFGNGGTG